MGFEPKRAGRNGRINPGLAPPCGFIAAAMDLAMMASTQGDSELIADLASKRPVLREVQMMVIRWETAANEASLLGYVPNIIAVANPARLRQRQHALVDRFRPPRDRIVRSWGGRSGRRL